MACGACTGLSQALDRATQKRVQWQTRGFAQQVPKRDFNGALRSGKINAWVFGGHGRGDVFNEGARAGVWQFGQDRAEIAHDLADGFLAMAKGISLSPADQSVLCVKFDEQGDLAL